MVQHSLGRPVPLRPALAAAPADFQDAPGAPDVGEHGDNPVTWPTWRSWRSWRSLEGWEKMGIFEVLPTQQKPNIFFIFWGKEKGE